MAAEMVAPSAASGPARLRTVCVGVLALKCAGSISIGYSEVWSQDMRHIG